MEYIPLTIKKIPHQGITLIEASAGTGKTFTIIILYLRLILKIGINKLYKNPLSINEILIVTFTEASKNELKKKLKKKIYQLYDICIHKNNNITDLKNLIKDIKDFKKVNKLLKIAKKNIDSISIYTLHGFFRYILLEQRFLCKTITPQNIISNIEKIQLQSTKDFWRKYVYHLDKNIIQLIFKKWNTPKKLFVYIQSWISQSKISFKYNFKKKKNLIQKYKKIINYIKKTKTIWKTYKKKIKILIKTIKINKKIYNEKRLKKWFHIIENWSQKKTKKCSIPKILKYFQLKKIQKNDFNQNNNQYLFFIYIEKIFIHYNIFFEYFIYLALKKIPKIIKKKKEEKNGLEFNDLNTIMWNQIKNKNSIIKKNIIKKYTMTIIDECQDIDDIQFNIFYLLYNKKNYKSLILIGDPKQSIYSFRGSNIFLYLKTKEKIKKCFFLEKNFRSSKNIVKGINILFSNTKNPFIFKKINFLPSTYALKNNNIKFVYRNVEQPAFNFIYNKKKTITKEEYYSWISKECANSIYNWLSAKNSKKTFIMLKNQKKRHINPSDITILVKNKYEASFIKMALEKKRIKTIYTSEKNNIFHSIEAKEIILILDSIANLSNELKFQKILITNIVKKNIYDIYAINQKKKMYYRLFKKLKKYYSIWNTINISKMIEEIILDFEISQSSTTLNQNQVNIQNILQLSDILEKKNEVIRNKFLLIQWFKKKISQDQIENTNSVDTINSEYDNNPKYVKIITVYKSKGLEYPIVWIPFFSNFPKKNNQIFFCRKKLKKVIDLKNTKYSQKLSKEENLSEDIRLLYVAITRSILHCNIGVAVIKKKTKKKKYTNFHNSSLGFLIQKGKKKKNHHVIQKFFNIEKSNIIAIQEKFIQINKQETYKKKKIKKKKNNLQKISRIIKYPWIKINFSKMIKYNFLKNKINITNEKKKHIIIKKKNTLSKINIHSFPKGKEYGIYLHDIFRKIKFYQTSNIEKIITKLNFLSISNKKIQKLYHWIYIFLSAPLNKKGFSLNQLHINQYQKEINFVIPIKKHIDINQFNCIIKKFDSLSKKCLNFFFKNVTGVLTGIIDLIFFWEKKYYIIDYKSNWLGPNHNYYDFNAMQLEMIKYRYDIQYQIYSVAIHRYLKIKIKNYDYDVHFGGIFYLFLRAFDDKNHSGIYFIKPSYHLIFHLDNLFHGKNYDTKK